MHPALVHTAVPGKGPDNGGEDYALSNTGNGGVEAGWRDLSAFGNTVSTGHGYIHDNYVHDLVPFINHAGYYQHTDAVIADGGGSGAARMIVSGTIVSAECWPQCVS